MGYCHISKQIADYADAEGDYWLLEEQKDKHFQDFIVECFDIGERHFEPKQLAEVTEEFIANDDDSEKVIIEVMRYFMGKSTAEEFLSAIEKYQGNVECIMRITADKYFKERY